MNRDTIEQAVKATREHLNGASADFALVLGSGWSDTVDSMDVVAERPFSELPLPGGPEVEGHRGRLLLARGFGATFLVFQGRRHWYEGTGWEPVVFPLYLSAACGVRGVVLTNAAGGLNTDYRPGELMLIRDHINWIGSNPLVGAHDPDRGARFPDQSEVYDEALRRHVLKAVREQGVAMHEGVYIATSGPAYETPSEVRAFRAMGADAVGMSTVPEAMVANWMGLRCLAVSCITNMAAGVGGGTLSHKEVIAVTEASRPAMRQVLECCCETMVATTG